MIKQVISGNSTPSGTGSHIGQEYRNTVTGLWYRWTGSSWQVASPLPLALTAVPVNGVPGVFAFGYVTFDNTRPETGSRLLINGRVYTYRDAGNTYVTDEIDKGTDLASTKANTLLSINSPTSGGSPNPDVTASTTVSIYAIRLTARIAGAAGNSITVTDDSGHISSPGTLSGGTDAVLGTVAALGQAAIVTHSDGTKTEWGCVDDDIIMRWAPRTAGIFMNRTTGLYERTFISSGTIQTENLPNQ